MTIRRKKETPVEDLESLENLETVEDSFEVSSEVVEVSGSTDEGTAPEATLPPEAETPEPSLTQPTENLRRRPEPLAKARPRRNSPKFSPKLK